MSLLLKSEQDFDMIEKMSIHGWENSKKNRCGHRSMGLHKGNRMTKGMEEEI